MFQAENQFYPTPKAIAEKMIAPYIETYRERIHNDLYDEVKYLKIDYPILEPSAGKGDLLDAIKDINDDNRRRMVSLD